MPEFSTGVKRYVKTHCVVEVNFPIDFKDKEYIACRFCPYLSSNERMCQLNKEPVAFPNTCVGAECPLILTTEEDEEDV